MTDDWTHQFVLYEPTGWRNRARWELWLRFDHPILDFGTPEETVSVAGETYEYVVMARGKIRRPRGSRVIRLKGKA